MISWYFFSHVLLLKVDPRVLLLSFHQMIAPKNFALLFAMDVMGAVLVKIH